MKVLIAAPSLLNPDACFVLIFKKVHTKVFFLNSKYSFELWYGQAAKNIVNHWLWLVGMCVCGGGSLFFSTRVSYHALKGKTTYLVSTRHFCEFWYIYRSRPENCVSPKIYSVRKTRTLTSWCKRLTDCIVFSFRSKFSLDLLDID